ncbi:MAG: lysophospholipid acyltransferase family protein [Roseiflexaceae bacterium]|nr:lysophospholipid acyltransferase family protein [Roseiflexaceae bacterium]
MLESADPQPEIPANHIPIAQEIMYRTLVIPAMRREFHWVRICVDGPIPRPADGPLVIYVTHGSWWDAYMLFLLYYRVLGGGFQNYIMMEAKQLRAYRFFAWCGAFSIDRKIPGDADRSLAYIANRLRERHDRCLWIFPQGRIAPTDRRPIVAYPGIARVVKQAGGATLWPVALRYEFRGEQQPEVLIRCGPLHYAAGDVEEEALTEEVRQRLTSAADQLRDDTLADTFDHYHMLLRGRDGINRWFDDWRARLAGRKPSSNR